MEKKRHWTSIAIIVILSLAMILTAVLSFFKGSTPYTISDGIVYIFGLVVVILISDSIETFSFGNLITLKKKVQEKETEVSKLSSENAELRNHITTIYSASIHNKNQNAMIIGSDDALRAIFKVEQATEEDSKNAKAAEQEMIEAQANQQPLAERPHTSISSSDRRRITERLGKAAIDKFISNNDINPLSILHEVKFSEQFIGCDPIMERLMVFDAYIKRPVDETFIELLVNPASPTFDYRLYYMISKIYHYATANKTVAKLLLIVPKLPEAFYSEYIGTSATHRNVEANIMRLKKYFSPAIKNNLLEVVEIALSEQECQSIIKEITH